MANEVTIPGTRERAVQAVTDLLEHCDYAAIAIRHRHGIETSAASNDEVRLLDQRQHEIGQGPCLEALREEGPVLTGDLRTDYRWPVWGGEMVAQLGVHSSLSFALHAAHRDLGVLTMYSKSVDAFDADVCDAQVVATHVSIALTAAIDEANLREAIETRMMIGEAMGILRERHKMASGQAFEYLRSQSMTHNIKLQALAKALCETGELPV
jgi:GAF domain-containing protein